MALSRYTLSKVAPYLKGAEVLCLSYPDLLVTPKEAGKMFDMEVTKFLPQSTSLRHSRRYLLPDTLEVFNHVCKSVRCVDVARFRNCEDIVDLNHPQDLGSYDLVLDPGTLEHCFHFGQALMNAANAVKVGGRILHASPCSMTNHGFYNICPTLFHDFYGQNGWKVELFVMHTRKGEEESTADMTGSEIKRIYPPYEAGLIVIAQRLTAAVLKIPVQSKYKDILQVAA